MPINSLQEFVDFVSSNEIDSSTEFDLSGWGLVDLKIYGERYNGALTPELAKSLYDFYMDLQRAYAYIKYGTPNLQKLTIEDKKIFGSIEYRIEEGSLEILGEISDQVSSMLDSLSGVLEGMDSAQKSSVLIVFIVALLGAYSVSSYFDYESQVAIADQERQQKEILVEGQVRTIEQIVELAETSIQALDEKRRGQVTGAIDKIDSGYENIIRAAPDADKIDISGAALNKEDIASYIDRSSSVTNEKFEKEELLVLQVSKRAFPKISVRFMNENDEQFTLNFLYGNILDSSYNNIYDAMKEGSAVVVEYNGLYNSEGVLKRGTLISVSEKPAATTVSGLKVNDTEEDEDEDEDEDNNS